MRKVWSKTNYLSSVKYPCFLNKQRKGSKMSNVLIISGHPNLDESNANSTMLKSITERLKSVSVRRLDTLYTANPIDVEAEQAALLEADVIVLQFPFYWY